MPTSDKIKALLALSGKKQIDLAEEFGMVRQAMGNKMARDSWSTADLIRVARFTNSRLLFETTDGQRIYLDTE